MTPTHMADLGTKLRVAVIIPTKGRVEVVRLLLARLREQTSQPDAIIIAACDPRDAADLADPSLQVVLGAPGIPHQRNAGLAALPASIDIVVFFDDDFIPSRYWIERTRQIFAEHLDVAAITGKVLADGIKTAGLSWDEGIRIVQRADQSISPDSFSILENFSPYGCNMAFRRKTMGDMKFDERLVLYAWQEDRDFGARVGKNGRMIRADALWGVHLGIKRGRVSGTKLGYSQIVNPRYLVAKGTMSMKSALRLAARNLAANAVLSLRPEPYIDRAGRLRGNLLGLWDLVTGKWYPERAADL